MSAMFWVKRFHTCLCLKKNTSIYTVVEDNNIYWVPRVGRNYGPCFLKGRLALCVAYDSGAMSYELRSFLK